MPTATRRVYLHVGLPKTGTTSLQELMWHNRNALAARGVVYPGEDWDAQHRAVMDVHARRYQQWHEPGVVGAWAALVEQVRDARADVVLSTELLAPASPAEAQRVREAFGDLELHIVCTVRDFARQVPSVWQENVKTGHTTSFAELLAAVRAPELTQVSRVFWDYQDLPRVLRTWGESLPPERVHVITVPRGGASTRVLWERFTTVLGVDGTDLTTRAGSYNQSLGHAETELLRRVNSTLDGGLDWQRYATSVKDHLAATILASHGSNKPLLPPGARQWAREVSQSFHDEITVAGYHVVGDLDELLPGPADEEPAQEGKAREKVDESRLLDIAVDALAALAADPPPQAGAPEEPGRPRMADVADVTRRFVRHSPPVRLARRLSRSMRGGIGTGG